MNQTIQRLLSGHEDNHIMPFFWQHGEDEATLRNMMRVINEANCGAVCVESRPHPDFCGPGWWADMDIILDEARRRGMKVWILDDSHFPTGFANGAVLKAEPQLCRQGIFCNELCLEADAGPLVLDLRGAGLLDAPKKKYNNPSEEAYFNKAPARVFGDDRILSVTACSGAEEIDLGGYLDGEKLNWNKPAGEYKLRVITASRNCGYHRDYINMMDAQSVKLLLDAVYEPHWQHYKGDFGKTIAGFFSDEPELGNGWLYTKGNTLGVRQDLPWSSELEARFAQAVGEGWEKKLARLWQQDDSSETSEIHFIYMDLVTGLVRSCFSEQLGDWCRAHGVQYIGHLIEDDGQHCRTGSSLGHYFRGLQGQDMAGIDDIGGQVLPQGEEEPRFDKLHRPRNGEFYHYGLAKLAQSAAAIEPAKHGNAMCEIFGNYGWAEGVRLEKYLADHFLVHGINYFVPHAFSGASFPDPDCPPHFYAQGHNPQYRHFGRLIKYINRVATLTSSGRQPAPVGILYHGESEWCDSEAMPFERPLHILYDEQIDCRVLPADVFREPERYGTALGKALQVNGQEYKALIIPACKRITKAVADGITALAQAGMPVFFVERTPDTLCEGGALPDTVKKLPVVALCDLADTIRTLELDLPRLMPADNRIRILKIQGETSCYLLTNEGSGPYTGRIFLPGEDLSCYIYDAWENRCEEVSVRPAGAGVQLELTIEPLKSKIIVFDECNTPLYTPPKLEAEISLGKWQRSTCEGAQYPAFDGIKEVALPDTLAQEQPEFSGFARYETTFVLDKATRLCMVVEDAHEGVEVFINGKSCGIQIAPPFIYEFEAASGNNLLTVEIATTLERQCYPLLEGYSKMMADTPDSESGLTGQVYLYTV